MKMNLVYCLSAATIALCGCASYNASALNMLSSETMHSSAFAKNNDVFVSVKAFTRADCKKYLDRDVIAKGYQPIQLCIQNNTDASYSFSLSRISLSCARAEEVAEKVHTSTVGRSVGYGAAAFFTCGLFAIPAVIDGVGSANANESLDNDFSSKTAMDATIKPHSHYNKIIFVPVNEYQQSFEIELIDLESNKIKKLEVIAN